MKHFYIAMFACCAIGPAAAIAQSTPAMVGVGAQGYDFLIGTWSCKNSAPSAMTGPAETTLTVTKTTTGALSVHSTGTNFDTVGYVTYDAKSKTWWNPSVYADADYSTESTKQTGKVTTWSGPFFDAETRKTTAIRDSYTITSLTRFQDVSQVKAGMGWKTQATIICTKS
jgi:hypothetical protein